jgi:hypothetical protein
MEGTYPSIPIRKTSLIPKNPTATGTNSIPNINSFEPKQNRSTLSKGQIPMVLNQNPRQIIMKLLMGDPARRFDKRTNANIMKAKYSGDPKASAAFPSKGAKTCNPIMVNVPAINDPTATRARAAPPLPLFVIWYPSMQVTTLADSPGIFTKIEVVEPP